MSEAKKECGTFNSDRTISGYIRWSCTCGRAVIRQPYMTDSVWGTTIVEFRNRHKARIGK